MVTVRGRLTPEVGRAAPAGAGRRARNAVPAGAPKYLANPVTFAETPTLAQQQADALALLAETALHHGLEPGAPAEHYQVVVHVDAPVLADPEQPGQSVLEDGARVPAETSQRLACDASRVVMRHDAEGRVVEIGARTRTIPPALRRALHHRDRGCRFPGCGVRFGQGHHIRHWANGGPTTLSNLALLCRRHHRAVHEEGYQLDRQPDGELRFRRPDGRVLPEVPPPPWVPIDPVTVATSAERGGRAAPAREDGDAGMAGRAAGRGLRDRRLASAGAWRARAVGAPALDASALDAASAGGQPTPAPQRLMSWATFSRWFVASPKVNSDDLARLK